MSRPQSAHVVSNYGWQPPMGGMMPPAPGTPNTYSYHQSHQMQQMAQMQQQMAQMEQLQHQQQQHYQYHHQQQQQQQQIEKQSFISTLSAATTDGITIFAQLHAAFKEVCDDTDSEYMDLAEFSEAISDLQSEIEESNKYRDNNIGNKQDTLNKKMIKNIYNEVLSLQKNLDNSINENKIKLENIDKNRHSNEIHITFFIELIKSRILQQLTVKYINYNRLLKANMIDIIKWSFLEATNEFAIENNENSKNDININSNSNSNSNSNGNNNDNSVSNDDNNSETGSKSVSKSENGSVNEDELPNNRTSLVKGKTKEEMSHEWFERAVDNISGQNKLQSNLKKDRSVWGLNIPRGVNNKIDEFDSSITHLASALKTELNMSDNNNNSANNGNALNEASESESDIGTDSNDGSENNDNNNDNDNDNENDGKSVNRHPKITLDTGVDHSNNNCENENNNRNEIENRNDNGSKNNNNNKSVKNDGNVENEENEEKEKDFSDNDNDSFHKHYAEMRRQYQDSLHDGASTANISNFDGFGSTFDYESESDLDSSIDKNTPALPIRPKLENSMSHPNNASSLPNNSNEMNFGHFRQSSFTPTPGMNYQVQTQQQQPMLNRRMSPSPQLGPNMMYGGRQISSIPQNYMMPGAAAPVATTAATTAATAAQYGQIYPASFEQRMMIEQQTNPYFVNIGAGFPMPPMPFGSYNHSRQTYPPTTTQQRQQQQQQQQQGMPPISRIGSVPTTTSSHSQPQNELLHIDTNVAGPAPGSISGGGVGTRRGAGLGLGLGLTTRSQGSGSVKGITPQPPATGTTPNEDSNSTPNDAQSPFSPMNEMPFIQNGYCQQQQQQRQSFVGAPPPPLLQRPQTAMGYSNMAQFTQQNRHQWYGQQPFSPQQQQYPQQQQQQVFALSQEQQQQQLQGSNRPRSARSYFDFNMNNFNNNFNNDNNNIMNPNATGSESNLFAGYGMPLPEDNNNETIKNEMTSMPSNMGGTGLTRSRGSYACVEDGNQTKKNKKSNSNLGGTGLAALSNSMAEIARASIDRRKKSMNDRGTLNRGSRVVTPRGGTHMESIEDIEYKRMRELLQLIDKKLYDIDENKDGFLTKDEFLTFLSFYRLNDKFSLDNLQFCYDMFVLKSKQKLKKIIKQKQKQEKNKKLINQNKNNNSSNSLESQASTVFSHSNDSSSNNNNNNNGNNNDSNSVKKPVLGLADAASIIARNMADKKREKMIENEIVMYSDLNKNKIKDLENLSINELINLLEKHSNDVLSDLVLIAITATYEKSPSIGLRRAVFRTCNKAIQFGIKKYNIDINKMNTRSLKYESGDDNFSEHGSTAYHFVLP